MRIRKRKRNIIGMGLIILVAVFFFSFPMRYAMADTSEGGINISMTPDPESIEIYDSVSWDEADGLTPADEMFVNFTINDDDTMANLDWVRITVYDSAKAAWNDANNHTDHMEFYWVQTGDSWNITGTSESWAINEGSCYDPSVDLSQQSFEFTLVFTPGTNAFEETTDLWRFNVTASDDDSLVGTNSTIESGTWAGTADFYQSLTIQTGATYYNFTASSPGGAAVQIYQTDAGAGAFLVFNVTANGVWDINCSVTDWGRQGGAEEMDVDADIQRIDDGAEFTNGNQEIDPDWINTTSTIFWDGSVQGYNNTQEDGQTKNIYLELSVPGGTIGGFYTQVLTVIATNG
jgi:hypothetical protein